MRSEEAIDIMVNLATLRIWEMQAQTNRHHTFSHHLAQGHFPTPKNTTNKNPTNARKEVLPIDYLCSTTVATLFDLGIMRMTLL
jgi:hypothetical protein